MRSSCCDTERDTIAAYLEAMSDRAHSRAVTRGGEGQLFWADEGAAAALRACAARLREGDHRRPTRPDR